MTQPFLTEFLFNRFGYMKNERTTRSAFHIFYCICVYIMKQTRKTRFRNIEKGD